MYTEFEATYTEIDKDEVRTKLKEVGAELIKKEFLQKRTVFNLPKGHEIKGGWLRVRDEGGKITMSLKVVDGDKIENQKEIELIVDDFESAVSLLKTIGCKNKAYQETKRELWELDNVEITIDEWPFLPPFIEVESDSEEKVKSVSEKLGFDYSEAKFCAVDTLYAEKYKITEDRINNHTPRIVFGDENPFID